MKQKMKKWLSGRLESDKTMTNGENILMLGASFAIASVVACLIFFN